MGSTFMADIANKTKCPAQHMEQLIALRTDKAFAAQCTSSTHTNSILVPKKTKKNVKMTVPPPPPRDMQG